MRFPGMVCVSSGWLDGRGRSEDRFESLVSICLLTAWDSRLSGFSDALKLVPVLGFLQYLSTVSFCIS